MFQQTIIALLIIYKLSFALENRNLLQSLPPGHRLGNYNQVCVFTTPETPTCAQPTDAASDINTPGYTNCEAPYSCCLCTSITCGTDTDPCEIFSAGSSGAFGVEWIDIIGYNNDNVIPTLIDCKGEMGCASSLIKGKYISKVQCSGRYSCSNAMIIIEEPNNGFELTCAQVGACEGLQIGINIGSNSQICDTRTNIKEIMLGSIECIGIESCIDLLFVINNRGCDKIIIDQIECRGGTCEGAQFKFIGNTNTINIANCDLPNGEMPNGLQDKCFGPSLNQMVCTQPYICQDEIHSIIDPINGFGIFCQAESACINAMFNIYIVNNNMYMNQNIIVININCMGVNACQNINILINNKLFNTKQVIVNYKCIGNGACDKSIFSTTSGISIQSVICDNILYCNGCKYNSIPCNLIFPGRFNMPPNGPNVIV